MLITNKQKETLQKQYASDHLIWRNETPKRLFQYLKGINNYKWNVWTIGENIQTLRLVEYMNHRWKYTNLKADISSKSHISRYSEMI